MLPLIFNFPLCRRRFKKLRFRFRSKKGEKEDGKKERKKERKKKRKKERKKKERKEGRKKEKNAMATH